MFLVYCVNSNNYYTDDQADCILRPALTGIVVGYWSQDGKPLPLQINTKHHNVFMYSRDDGSLYEELITTFSYDGSTIIEATESGK